MTKAYVITNDIEVWDAIPDAPVRLLALAEAKKSATKVSAVSGAPVDAAKLREAGGYADCGARYPIWRDCVAAIGAANCSEARQIAHEFSEGKLDRLERYKASPPENYSGPSAVDLVLDTMPPMEGGIGVGTIDKVARDAGWKGTLAPREDPTAVWQAYAGTPEAKETAAPQATRANLFSTRAQDRDRPPQQWRIDSLIEEGTDVALVAPSKFLKSFLAVYLGYSVATGTRALGKLGISHPGLVFYCAGEGGHSLKDRITACEIAHGAAPYSAERFRVAGIALTLDGDGEAQITIDAKAHIRPGENVALTINDTLNRALNGADEDKSSTASAYFNMLARHRAAVGGSTLTVHHLGKDKLKGMRGSSAFFAGFDTVIVIDKAEKDETTGSYFLTVRVDKQKNGEDGQVFFLQARKVETSNGSNLALFPAGEDDLRRVAGKQVGLRRSDVGAALNTIEAFPGGANEWTGKVGGVPTRPVAIEIARARIVAAGDSREPTEKEIDVLVAALNKGARQGGPFVGFVVREGKGGRQWAIAPGPVNGGANHA